MPLSEGILRRDSFSFGMMMTKERVSEWRNCGVGGGQAAGQLPHTDRWPIISLTRDEANRSFNYSTEAHCAPV